MRTSVERVSRKLGRRIKFLVGKPGLDGHSNGAEQIAVRARDAGMEVVYEGIRLTPAEIVNAALEEGVHVVGLSILSGSHVPLVTDVVARMRAAGLDDVPVIVGGIIPPDDARDAEGRGRRGGLHAEGFRAEPHHGGHRAHRGHRRRQGGVTSDMRTALSAPVSPPLRGEGGVRGIFRRATALPREPLIRLRPSAFGTTSPRCAGRRKDASAAGLTGFARKAFMPAASAASTSAGSVRPDMPMMRHARDAVRQRADRARRLEAVEARQRHVHQHDVVGAALDRRDRRLAGAGEVGAMAELGQDRVEHDARVRIVLGAQHAQAARRGDAPRRGGRLCRSRPRA